MTKPDKRARTRDQLLAAAQQLLQDQTAGTLGIRQVTDRAGVVHATFYNYYPSIEALVEDLADLIFAAHVALVAPIRAVTSDPAELFSLITRQSLRCTPLYGRLLFDAGLPIDRFLTRLRQAMRQDLVQGVETGRFERQDVDLALGMTNGAILGVALDIHRGHLTGAAIEPAVERLLRQLGVAAREARDLATAEAAFLQPQPLPLGWITLQARMEEIARAA
ncbi:MAG: TetR/AcrR family transcriptional regulator [Caulobacter sp.]